MSVGIRRVGFVAIAAIGVVIWVVLAPPPVADTRFNLSVGDYAELVNQALDDADANESRADSAPQQQVVNGWVARDLLTIIALQNTDLLEGIGLLGEQAAAVSVPTRDDRVPALVGLAVLAICWHGISTPDEHTAGRLPSVPDPGFAD